MTSFKNQFVKCAFKSYLNGHLIGNGVLIFTLLDTN